MAGGHHPRRARRQSEGRPGLEQLRCPRPQPHQRPEPAVKRGCSGGRCRFPRRVGRICPIGSWAKSLPVFIHVPTTVVQGPPPSFRLQACVRFWANNAPSPVSRDSCTHISDDAWPITGVSISREGSTFVWLACPDPCSQPASRVTTSVCPPAAAQGQPLEFFENPKRQHRDPVGGRGRTVRPRLRRPGHPGIKVGPDSSPGTPPTGTNSPSSKPPDRRQAERKPQPPLHPKHPQPATNSISGSPPTGRVGDPSRWPDLDGRP